MVFTIEQEREILENAKLLWGIKDSPELIRNLQNAVYKISISGKSAILRLTNSDHRNTSELHQELEWASFLSNNGCNVAYPIESINGRLVEKIQFNNCVWFSAVFSFAVGRPIEEPDVLCPKTLFAWGRELGKVHNLAMRYEPSYVRDSYQSLEKYRLNASSHVTAPGGVSETIERINKWINSLPKEKSNYGMIHGDCVNFHAHEDEITFFDFDDCTYHWFAFDIANGLYSLLFIIQNEGINFALTFKECVEIFVQGYRTEKDIEKIWVDRIPCFVNYRTALLCQWLKTPETAPLWVLDMDQEWRAKLEEWIKEHLDFEMNLV